MITDPTLPTLSLSSSAQLSPLHTLKSHSFPLPHLASIKPIALSLLEMPSVFLQPTFFQYMMLLQYLIQMKTVKCSDLSKKIILNFRQYFMHLQLTASNKICIKKWCQIAMKLIGLGKKDKNEGWIRRIMFSKKVRTKFLNWQIWQGMNDQGLSKAIGDIMLYFLKVFRQKESKNIKIFILKNMEKIQEFKLKFYFFFIFSLLINTISVEEIKNYKVAEFLISCLPSHSESEHAFYLFVAIEVVLEKQEKLSVKFLKGKILKYFDSGIFQHERVVINIFKRLIMFIPKDNLYQCLIHHVQYLLNGKINDLSFKIITAIVNSKQQDEFYLLLLKEKWMPIVLNIEDEEVETEVRKLISTLREKVRQISLIYENGLMNMIKGREQSSFNYFLW